MILESTSRQTPRTRKIWRESWITISVHVQDIAQLLTFWELVTDI